jgi:endonuclease/exonuclease/phosphatase (EEP) superfamily protein YafD
MNNKEFVIVNPQLTSLSSNKLRYAQIRLMVETVKKITIPTFIIGDFNIPSIRAKNSLLKFMSAHGFSSYEKRLRTYRLGFIKYQLDYAFARNGKIEEVNVERVKFSDHYPISVVIQPRVQAGRP